MATLVSTIEIARPPHDVFAYATDPSRFGEWQDDVVRVQVDGVEFTTTRRINGAERTMRQQITHNDPPHRWAARGIDGPIRPHATVTVEPLDDGTRSRVTLTLDFERHGIGAALLPLVRRQSRRAAPISYQKLKQVLERRH
ncbi:SRPBCC family protein [Micromonospora halotolerans]|uniref:SRPBCC family protein n=1 Tax=Micromonospora halotolerans TaxID=709879 RepID=A0ABY9ZTZ2_9ACTN|nr:SRPBCC family protein [Micromonospora halotolerans]WNM38703.1 SRPBCC family protein [Micromonospora halotolerans]